ncbi:MAG: hypothetical protein LLG37_10580 [Spirochaetia bacterium]|nr:hypothetical protein [Spirochaetia bacterium]
MGGKRFFKITTFSSLLVLFAAFTSNAAVISPADITKTARTDTFKKVIMYVFENSSFKYQIACMDLNGDNKKILTREGDNWSPAVSPDGSAIAFYSNRSGYTNLWIMNSDGSYQRQLTAIKEDITAVDLLSRGQIAWSNDGTLIYFLNGSDIWQIDRTGETPSSLTGWHDVTMFRLSPDRDRFLFSRAKTKRHNGLWTMNTDGSLSRQITPSLVISPAFDWGDKNFICYFHNRAISTIESTGINKKLIKESYYPDNEIEWSKTNADRNQNWIAYISDNNKGPNIWIMKPDGSGEKQITFNGGYAPSWLPDGTSLLVVESNDIYRINVATMEKNRLTYNFNAFMPCTADIKYTAAESTVE